jgi:membrane protein implicated in regulation of membrane protease activity
VFVLWAIAIIAFAVILFVRPVTLSLVLWTIVLALLAALLVTLLERPAPEAELASADVVVDEVEAVELVPASTGVVGAEVIEAEDAETPTATS